MINDVNGVFYYHNLYNGFYDYAWIGLQFFLNGKLLCYYTIVTITIIYFTIIN
jgi:hypothetical protein